MCSPIEQQIKIIWYLVQMMKGPMQTKNFNAFWFVYFDKNDIMMIVFSSENIWLS